MDHFKITSPCRRSALALSSLRPSLINSASSPLSRPSAASTPLLIPSAPTLLPHLTPADTSHLVAAPVQAAVSTAPTTLAARTQPYSTASIRTLSSSPLPPSQLTYSPTRLLHSRPFAFRPHAQCCAAAQHTATTHPAFLSFALFTIDFATEHYPTAAFALSFPPAKTTHRPR